MPGVDLFDNNDFNIRNSKLPMLDLDTNKTSEIENAETSNLETDSDSEEDDDDFIEVPEVKSKSEIEAEREVEMKYLGFAKNSANATENAKSGFTIDINLLENEENKVLFETMRDLYKELKNSHLVKVNNWIKV
jgi:hypothetical protein